MPLRTLTREWTCNLGTFPGWESNLQPFGAQQDAPTNWDMWPGPRPFLWHQNQRDRKTDREMERNKKRHRNLGVKLFMYIFDHWSSQHGKTRIYWNSLYIFVWYWTFWITYRRMWSSQYLESEDFNSFLLEWFQRKYFKSSLCNHRTIKGSMLFPTACQAHPLIYPTGASNLTSYMPILCFQPCGPNLCCLYPHYNLSVGYSWPPPFIHLAILLVPNPTGNFSSVPFLLSISCHTLIQSVLTPIYMVAEAS